MNRKAIEKAEEFKRQIGKVIRFYRKDCKLKQSNLATALGVKESTISRYENGKGEITAATMAKISHICHFELREYVDFDERSVSYLLDRVTRYSGINPHHAEAVPPVEKELTPGQLKNVQVVEYMRNGSVLVSADMMSSRNVNKPSKTDMLYDFPNEQPMPVCDDDRILLETHLLKPDNEARLRILQYGYKLLNLYEYMDTPYSTTSSLAKQLLRRVIKTPDGKVDDVVFDYYIKTLYEIGKP